MKQRNLFLLILLLLITVMSLSHNDPLYSTFLLDNSYQSLTIYQDYYQLQFSYHQHSANIPISFVSLLQKSSISELTLLMGIDNNSSTLLQHKQRTNPLIIYHGIALILKNSSQLLESNFQSITQSLSISRSQQYIVYIEQSQAVYISNPNDKFCSQHLNTIVDLFLPCGSNAGIGSIINQKSFFIDKKLIGLKLYWNIERQIIKLILIMDKSSQQVKNYMKLPQQKRQSRRCMHFQTLTIITFSQVVSETSYQQLQKIRKLSIHDDQTKAMLSLTTSISTELVSNYYGRDKLLLLSVDLNKLMRELLQSGAVDDNVWVNSNNDGIIFTVRLRLPEGFQMQKVTYDCEHCGQLLNNVTIHHILQQKANHDIVLQQRFYSCQQQPLYLIKVTLNSKNILQSQQMNSTNSLLIYKFFYLSFLKPFQEYENIAGGGEEFMNIPFTLQLKNRSTILIMSNSMRNIFDRLIEPDFSIPFKTITFTLVIIGYLWIALWRAFYAQNKYFHNLKISQHLQQNEISVSIKRKQD